MPTGVNTFLTDAANNVGVIAPLGNLYVSDSYPILMASYHMSITNASGGTNLPNVPCGKIELQNLSGNGVMWVGGVGQSAPYSGRGLEMPAMFHDGVSDSNGQKTMLINNANQISLCAAFSGQLISFVAYGNSTTTVIDPGTQGIAPNVTPPVLSGTTPVSGSINGTSNVNIIYTFNEPMDPNNISGIYVVGSGQANPSLLGHLGGTLSYFSGDTLATFTPNSGQLQLSGWYIPMVDSSCEAFNGIPMSGGLSYSGSPFQIQGPPIVSGTVPLSGTTGVSGQPVIVTFSQPMLSGAINLSGIFLVSSGTTSPHISGTVFLISSNQTQGQLTVASGVLALSTWYIPIITTNCQDQFGNPLNQLTSGGPFQTPAAPPPPDTTPPTVSGTTPASGATNVLVIPTIMITMSEAVNSGLVTTNTVKVHDIQTGDVNVPGTVSLQSDLITIDWTPNGVMNNLDLHRMELSGIKDLANNFMTPFSGATFTIESVLQVSGTTPASGASSVSVSVTPQITMDRAVLSGTVNSNTVKLVDGNGVNVTLSSVSLTNDNLTIAFAPSTPLGYLASYAYEISGVVDINNQQFMFPFSGALFNTIAPSLTQVYNVVGSNQQLLANSTNTNNDTYALGESITSNSANMFNKVIKQASFSLQRLGSPTGNVVAYVRDGSHNIQTTLGSMPAASVSTSQASYTFTNLSGSFALPTNGSVTVEYSGGNGSNGIYAYYNNGNAYSSTKAIAYFITDVGGGQGWSTNLGITADVAATISY